jgi:hypothetical protein
VTRIAAAVLAVLLLAAPTADAAPRKANRYKLVNGCYAMFSASAKRYVIRTGNQFSAKGKSGTPFRMQATSLGRYSLVARNGSRPAIDSSGALTASPTATQSAVWVIKGATSTAYKLTSATTGKRFPVGGSRFEFRKRKGCRALPEAQVNARGKAFKSASAISDVRGTIDPHTHVTAFEFIGGDFHCGRPWHPFGVTFALPDCASIQGPQGSAAPVQNFVDYGEPEHPHDTVGWPTFHDWPGPDKLSYEGTYYTGLKRAYLAGLRIMVTDLVDNEALCSIMSMRRNPCNDMASVRIQSKDAFRLQNYIDAQSGGPGKGWLRIVTSPFQARKVVNQGKLALVQGVEVSRVFGCGEHNHVSECNRADVDRGLAEFKKMGVSSFYPVHKFDNAFGGTKMDGGGLGVVINGGNHLETGHFWDVKTCSGPAEDSRQLTPGDIGAPINTITMGVSGTPMAGLVPGGTAPVYPPGPHCNQQGLTDLGAYLIGRMMDQHFLIEVDHMDVKTGDKALSLMQQRHYSGVVSPHSWSSPQQFPAIYKLGGFITPIAHSSPTAFVEEWKQIKKMRDKRFRFGFGYGSDMNGLAAQSEPTAAHPVPYPFRSADGRVSFQRERWGQRVFDINKDGVANYGMYADWLAELRILGGPAMTNDMMSGAESYLETWERAYGVPAIGCRPAALRTVKVGDSSTTVLKKAGQPSSRPGRTFRYCGGKTRVLFNSKGRVARIARQGNGG